MRYVVTIPRDLVRSLRVHLFQNELEQGAFLFARMVETLEELHIEAVDAYLIPPDGWQVQLEAYLEMSDAERAKIMKIARDGNFAVVDCHSHPGSEDHVWFSPSDRDGITEFAAYAKWKLDGKPYTAMVWGESSVDAVAWCGSFTEARRVSEVRIAGSATRFLTPRGTWFRKVSSYWQGKGHAD